MYVFDSVLINVLASTGFVAGGLSSIAVMLLCCALMGISFILRGVFIQDYSGLVITIFAAYGR
jgi:hypothetical protein